MSCVDTEALGLLEKEDGTLHQESPRAILVTTIITIIVVVGAYVIYNFV